jgi:hypothetical protein
LNNSSDVNSRGAAAAEGFMIWTLETDCGVGCCGSVAAVVAPCAREWNGQFATPTTATTITAVSTTADTSVPVE